MSTRDPFLMTFGIWIDRMAEWLTLTGVSFLLLWALVWQRGLGQPWTGAMRQLQTVLRGQADPIVNSTCVPRGWARYTNRFILGPSEVIPGTPTIHDFYGR